MKKAANVMLMNKIGALVVTDNKAGFVGIITERDLLKVISICVLRYPYIPTSSPPNSLHSHLSLILSFNPLFPSVPCISTYKVADGTVDRDVAVENVMTTKAKILKCKGSDSIIAAMTTINNHNIRHLPVINDDNNQLQAIISIKVSSFPSLSPSPSAHSTSLLFKPPHPNHPAFLLFIFIFIIGLH